MKKNDEFSRKSTPFLKSACLALCLVSFGGTAAYAESSYATHTMLTIQMNGKSIKDVFSYIEKNSEFIFIYHGSNINLNRKVNVDVTNRSVDKILQQMFDGTDVEYFINDRQIIVRKKQVAEKTVPMIQQEKKITVMGNVKDENGEPLIGVNVVVRGTMIGCVTDIDGNFSLADVSENAVISISYIGYQTQDIPVKATINVVLKEDSEALNEVVVIGYGTQKKVDLSGAVATVSTKVLENRPVLTVGQA
ncbi:STN domain-containing protein, partial [Parabacteroides merdae]